METIEIEKCTVCKSSVIDDAEKGEKICSGCGIVMQEHMEDHGPEARSNSLEDKMKLARATGQTSYSQHDLGIATEISVGATDFSGKKINAETASQMHRLATKNKSAFITRQKTIKRLGKSFRNLPKLFTS